ncbi:MAG: asparagine synthase (glutamine-hydrolyzing) [Bacteroidota bacterium]
MCGITGFIDFKKNTSPETLVSMRDSLVHRGPDDSGEYIADTQSATVGFGFRRLSIIDLSPLGHQPMTNDVTGDVTMLNGEIYNYKELRKDLEALGHTFKSNSDTEVVLKAYQQYGTKCVDGFIGMFAIALHDKKKNRIVFFRDRAGVKPYYWYWQNDLFLFGSELKTFHRHPRFKKEIDTDALSLYFQHGYISAPYCIFKNAHKLMPGHILTIDLASKNISIEKYWDVTDEYNRPKLDIGYDEAVDTTERLLSSAFQYRMVADVPVGVFLSGGYDSSCVTALLQKNSSKKIKTYTIGFHEKEYNEADHAKKVAEHLGTDHHEYYCTIKDALDLVPQLSEIYDEPFGDSSGIPTTLVSRIAREHVTVALSADGGDEIFAGYPRHKRFMNYWKKFSMVPNGIDSMLSSVLKMVHSKNKPASSADRLEKLILVLRKKDPVKAFEIIHSCYTEGEAQKLIKQKTKHLHTVFDENDLFESTNDTLARIIATEYKTYMVDDILQKVDRATMSASLEGREPFLDQRVIEFVSKLPSGYKYRDGVGKIILRDITHQYIPKEIMDRPKMGFGVPVEKWLKNELKDFFEDTFQQNSSTDVFSVLNKSEVENLKKEYLAGRLEYFERLWYVFFFMSWYKRWMN